MKLLSPTGRRAVAALFTRPRGLLAVGAIAVGGSGFVVGREVLQQPEPSEAGSALVAAADSPRAVPPTDTSAPLPTPPPAAPPSPAGLEVRLTAPRIVPVAKPEHVRGLYLNAWAAGSPTKLQKLIDIARRTEINSFVIDVKEGGEVSYRSSIPLVQQVGADRSYIRDVRAVLQQLRDAGIYPIARIVAFRDETLAKARPEWAVQREDGTLWLDNAQHAWVDSYHRDVWDYNIAIAREAVELGFAEVQWDYVRFPDVPRSYMATARWPASAGRSKEDAIREFLLYSRTQLAAYGVPVTADVFGLTVSASDDMGIGQLWSKLVDATDVLLPMVYPSHFARGSYGIARPNARPYETVRKAMEYARRRTPDAPGSAGIRPWLQDFSLGPPRYGPAHVRAQIQAVYDAGLTEWVLWHPGSNYTVAALADADGTAPAYALPGEAATPGAGGPVPLGVPVEVDTGQASPAPRPAGGG
jgi:hypothetical protein